MANNAALKIGGVLLLLFLFKKKKNTVIVDEPTDAKSADADYLVIIRSNAGLYDKTTKLLVGTMANRNSVNWDGFNTNELPVWLKVRDKAGVYYYVKQGDFKIV
jgi:hypothetical protein